jgi:hypothetical protein
MKLAHVNLIVVHNDASHRPVPRRCLAASTGTYRHAAKVSFIVRRTPNRLAAHWRICPQTQRLECSWSLEAAVSDDHLCHFPIRRRRVRARLSQIRNRRL